jgi:hypothetical protein
MCHTFPWDTRVLRAKDCKVKRFIWSWCVRRKQGYTRRVPGATKGTAAEIFRLPGALERTIFLIVQGLGQEALATRADVLRFRGPGHALQLQGQHFSSAWAAKAFLLSLGFQQLLQRRSRRRLNLVFFAYEALSREPFHQGFSDDGALTATLDPGCSRECG